MKRILLIYICLLLFACAMGISSCNKNCNDCGPSSIESISLTNKSNTQLSMMFYFTNPDIDNPITSIDTVKVEPQNISYLYKSGNGAIWGELRREPYSSGNYGFDSIQVFKNNIYQTTYLKKSAYANQILCAKIITY